MEGGAGPQRVGSATAYSTLTPRSSPASSPRAKEPQGRDPRSGDMTRDTRSYRARSCTPRPLTPYRPSTRARNMRRAELDASTPRREKDDRSRQRGKHESQEQECSRSRAPATRSARSQRPLAASQEWRSGPEAQRSPDPGRVPHAQRRHGRQDAEGERASSGGLQCVFEMCSARVVQSTRAVTRSQADYSSISEEQSRVPDEATTTREQLRVLSTRSGRPTRSLWP